MKLTSVTKSTCERYDFKFEGCGWAVFTMFQYIYVEAKVNTGYTLVICRRSFNTSMLRLKEQIEAIRNNFSKSFNTSMLRLKLDGSMSCDHLQHEIFESGCIRKIWTEPWFEIDFDKEYPTNAVIFAKEIMPIFAAVLRQELGLE